MADYVVKLHYDYIGRETHSGSHSTWIRAKRSFDDWCSNLGHAPEIKRVELIVRGKVEESKTRA